MGYLPGVNAPPTLRPALLTAERRPSALLPAERRPFGGQDLSACLLDKQGPVVALEEREPHPGKRDGVFEHPADVIGCCLGITGAPPAGCEPVAVGWDVPRIAAITGEGWRFGSADANLRPLGFEPAAHRPDRPGFPILKDRQPVRD